MFGGSTDIGIDLGTANILVYVKGKGIVLNEPSVVAVEKAGNRILAGKSFFFKPRVMTCIPVHITSVEKRAVLEATIQAGVSKTYLIEEPLAAALGAGLDIMVPSGKMVVDIGGGTTDIGILSLGGVVDSDSVRIGGDKFDESIVRYVKKEYNILIGDTTGEEIKKTIGNVYPGAEIKTMEVRGRDGINGLPATVTVTSEDVRKAEHCWAGLPKYWKRKRGSVYLWQTIRWIVWLSVPERRWTIWTNCDPVQYTAMPCFKLNSSGTAMEALYCSASMPSC